MLAKTLFAADFACRNLHIRKRFKTPNTVYINICRHHLVDFFLQLSFLMVIDEQVNIWSLNRKDENVIIGHLLLFSPYQRSYLCFCSDLMVFWCPMKRCEIRLCSDYKVYYWKSHERLSLKRVIELTRPRIPNGCKHLKWIKQRFSQQQNFAERKNP